MEGGEEGDDDECKEDLFMPLLCLCDPSVMPCSNILALHSRRCFIFQDSSLISCHCVALPHLSATGCNRSLLSSPSSTPLPAPSRPPVLLPSRSPCTACIRRRAPTGSTPTLHSRASLATRHSCGSRKSRSETTPAIATTKVSVSATVAGRMGGWVRV